MDAARTRSPAPTPNWAAIDFGTSNSAVALPASGAAVRLVELEDGESTMPTAVFFRADTPSTQFEAERHYGRAAIAAYVDGHEGRLMRSLKSILGSSLLDQATDIGAGRNVRYRDVLAGILRHLKLQAEASAGRPLTRAVLGRPVYFVDDDPARDASAQAALEQAARAVGFQEVQFQYEPLAAALDLELRLDRERRVLVADIGGGTSDFSLVRLGPARRGRVDRQDDILANHGVHRAGTDFDRQVSLAAIMPLLGYRSRRAPPRGAPPDADMAEVPSAIYFDLASWHLINTVYAPARLAELRSMRDWYRDPAHPRRLLAVLVDRLGHALAARAEAAKIQVAQQGQADIELAELEPGLQQHLATATAAEALAGEIEAIEAAALETVRRAGVAPVEVDAIYFTGGSTGFTPLVERIAARFPGAERALGDRFASVALGLGEHARVVFGDG
ncbi:MAG: Hsp70 family protein [Rubrivivax sp.]|nr:Hsp70 family protein [Rubrivivax sp.]